MRLRSTVRERTGLPPALGLLLISGLWAISSLSSDLLPRLSEESLSPSLRQAVLFAVFTSISAAVAVARGLKFPRGRLALACCAIGLGLFVLPSALASLAQDTISALDRVAVFSLTPVFAVVLQPYLQDGPPARGKAALAGSLCAVAGILFVFPLDLPRSVHAIAALFALGAAALGIAATNCFAVRLARSCADGSILPMAAQAGAFSAVCFAIAGVITHPAAGRWNVLQPGLLVPFAVDLPALFLLFWLMRHLAASRMTARFLLAPLFTILAGIALQPGSPPERAWLGMALLAAGAGWLVFAPAEESEGSELNLRSAPIAESPRLPPPG
jgi:drug/metabolite transporter (DMT)-like permease